MNIISIGTGSNGGISSVIRSYEEDGLYDGLVYHRVVSHKGNSKFEDLWLFVVSIFQVFKLSLNSNKVIYHCHMSYNGSFWRKLTFLLLSKITRSKCIVHLHGSEFKEFYKKSSWLRKQLIYILIHQSDRFVVLSEGWSSYVKEITGVEPAVVPNYIRVPKIEEPFQSERSGLLFLAGFIPRKGIYDLLHAYSHLHTHEKLHLCGAGEDDKVLALIRALNIEDRVILHGWVDRMQKFHLLNSCSIFVLPTYNEGLPLSMLEAMACRTAVITTPVGAIPEVIQDGVNGILVEPGNIEQLVKAISYLLSDKKVCKRLTDSAFTQYESSFTPESVLPVMKRIYESL